MFPVYKNMKSLEQKGQVATTHLLLLGFSLPLLTALKPNKMLARAPSIAMQHREGAVHCLSCWHYLHCHSSMSRRVLLFTVPLLLVKANTSPILFLINVELNANHAFLDSLSEQCLQPPQV